MTGTEVLSQHKTEKRGLPRGPEILAPAGSPERLQTALTYGAHAVYLGGPDFNLRAQSLGFTLQDLHQALQTVHALGRRVYYCLNTLPWPEQMPALQEHLALLAQCPPDALIVADPGVLDLARDVLPQVPIHLSTQANTGNAQAARFWQGQGVTRVNLARELSFKGIGDIRRSVPDLELEVFVHGAMCMAISGRCHMSAYLNQRSANQGQCTHPCRFQYRPVTLEEAQRPGEALWDIQDQRGYSALLASEDLALIDFMAWLVKTGVDGLKIEGRMKTSSYLAQVLDVYVTALADVQSRTFRPKLYWQELRLASTRPLGTGFFLPGRRKRLYTPKPGEPAAPVVGKILSQEEKGGWRVSCRHQWPAGHRVSCLIPGLKRPVLEPTYYALENERGERIQVLHSGQTGRLRCEHPDLAPGLMLRRCPGMNTG